MSLTRFKCACGDLTRQSSPGKDSGRFPCRTLLHNPGLSVIFSVILFCLSAGFFQGDFCLAGTVGSRELINDPGRYDGTTVTFRGEAVGDIMYRGQYGWVNLYDGYAAVGIWAEKESFKDIVYLGGYRVKGDIIEVSGVFNKSCPEHGGDLDIHAVSIKRAVPGGVSILPPDTVKMPAALLFTAVVAVLILFLRTK